MLRTQERIPGQAFPRNHPLAFPLAFPLAPLLTVLGILPFMASCRNYHLKPSDMPTVLITTTEGTEQGVLTTEGVLFLGRTSQQGPAKVLYYLGPSPLVEAGEIKRMGGPLMEVDLEVNVPWVPISFEALRLGELLELYVIEDGNPRRYTVMASTNKAFEGTLVTWPEGLSLSPEKVGCGVFRKTPKGLSLVGLVKATAVLERGTETDRYLVLAGLPEIRLALLEPTPAVEKEGIYYRADGLRAVKKAAR